MAHESWDLDDALLTLSSKHLKSYFRIKDSFTNTLVTGSLGSGKSTSSYAILLGSMLRKGYGGIVFTTKPTDVEDFYKLCLKAGREKDIINFSPNSPYCFNFIEEEAKVSDIGLTENIISLLKTIIHLIDDKESGKGEDPFWADSLDNLIANVLHLCKLAYGKITIPLVYQIVITTPTDRVDIKKNPTKEAESAYQKAFRLARTNVQKQVDKWKSSLSVEKQKLIEENRKLYMDEVVNSIPDARQLTLVDIYFANTWVNLSEKTRSIIYMQFSNFLNKFLQNPLYSMFCKSETTISPNDCLDGKLIVLSMSIKEYQKIGRDMQLVFKICAQRMLERRKIDDNGRPVFFAMDEFQNFLVDTDFLFHSTCRSSRLANICVVQNLSSLYASLGGQKARDKISSILGTYSNFFMHCNTHSETNNYASELIGEAYFEDESTGVSIGEGFTRTRGKSYKLQKMILPQAFQKLKNGGRLNDYKVEAYFFRLGELFFNGQNFIKVTFDQQL